MIEVRDVPYEWRRLSGKLPGDPALELSLELSGNTVVAPLAERDDQSICT